MRLYHHGISIPLIDNNNLTLFQVENTSKLYKLLIECRASLDGEQYFTLSRKGSLLKFSSKVQLVTSPLDLEFSERSLTTAFHKKLEQSVFETGRNQEIWERLLELEDLIMGAVLSEGEMETTGDIPPFSKILGLFGVKLKEDYDRPFIEILIDYSKVKSRYQSKDLFLMFGILSYLSFDDLEAIDKFAKLEKLQFLFIENGAFDMVGIPFGRHIILDKDDCEILIRET